MNDKVRRLKAAKDEGAGLRDLVIEAEVGEVDGRGRAKTLVGWPGQDGPVAVRGHMDAWMPVLARGDRVVALPGPHGPYILFRLESGATANFDERGRRVLTAEEGFVIGAGASVAEFDADGVTRIKARYIDIEADQCVRIFSDGIRIN